MSDPFLDDPNRRSRHDQSAYLTVPEAVHTAPFQSELSKQWVQMLIKSLKLKQAENE